MKILALARDLHSAALANMLKNWKQHDLVICNSISPKWLLRVGIIVCFNCTIDRKMKTKQFWFGFLAACIIWMMIFNLIEIPEYIITHQSICT